ncbi:MAG: T9SS type A sorting domain-containing protein [Ignavibacteriae bacterium]|nr:T9SS type A sorting domain-containing protein [Ignavibacteriota bacterium]
MSVQFSDANNGWISGQGGTILYTTNGGTNWLSQTTNTTKDLYSIFFVNQNTGWAVGDSGIILKTTSGGVLSVEQRDDLIPSQFTLSDNYPNPFNPTTKISFSIPAMSFVSIKIFDVLGKEVATIVNEELSAGNYTQEWNAQGIESGVYFYQIQAGTYVETKKLILLR